MLDDGCIVVRKPTGTKKYVVKRTITIHGLPGHHPITSSGVVFLCGDEGDIHAVSEDTALAVDMNLKDAIELLENIREALR